ncbi:hypothetical protein [Flammeovirga sp. SubArs3]|uniref:hypothetical protein n=1 Tax=Flammeovirga sp. SubArs3 TaxID=2995316 RepID=UPI00248B047A|nr:hypothetical protein [Flammeovirga sp. SubArs3]
MLLFQMLEELKVENPDKYGDFNSNTIYTGLRMVGMFAYKREGYLADNYKVIFSKTPSASPSEDIDTTVNIEKIQLDKIRSAAKELNIYV